LEVTANHFQQPFNLRSIPIIRVLFGKEKEAWKLYGVLLGLCEMLGMSNGKMPLTDDQNIALELDFGEDYEKILSILAKRKVIIIKDKVLTSPIYDMMMEKYEASRERCRQGGIASAQARAEKAAKKAEKEPKEERPRSEKNVEYHSRPAVILD